jgi:cytochrome d ubiquinol oxidase subunit II
LHLYDIPLVLVLIGLALYTVLGGADFGAGFWTLLSGRGRLGRAVRDHAHDSIAPVWEANHVWLIFVLTVTWTAYPSAFGSIASTLSVPLLIAGVGIVLRGASYALRAAAGDDRERDRAELVFATSSILTPFALGAAVGAIASGRVPVGNAAGAAFGSWLSPTGVLLGVLAVASCAYLAAVFLAADAARRRQPELEQRFRRLALGSGVAAGVIAAAGLAVLHGDAHHLYARLAHGRALPGPIVSAVAGLATLELVRRRRYEAARFSAALAVAAIIAGWALAQSPQLLPGLSLHAAAAPRDTLVALLVAIAAGAVILFPSLGLLFSLVLRGRFEGEAGVAALQASRGRTGARSRGVPGERRSGSRARIAVAGLIAGVGLLTIAEAGWAHAVGVLGLLVFVICGFAAIVPSQLEQIAARDSAGERTAGSLEAPADGGGAD